MVEDCGGGAGAGSLFVAGMYVIPFADIAVFNPVGIGSLLGRHALGVAHFLPGPTSALVGWVEKVGKLDDKEGEGGVAEARQSAMRVFIRSLYCERMSTSDSP